MCFRKHSLLTYKFKNAQSCKSLSFFVKPVVIIVAYPGCLSRILELGFKFFLPRTRIVDLGQKSHWIPYPDSGFRIQDPFFSIPDPPRFLDLQVKKAEDPGSGSATPLVIPKSMHRHHVLLGNNRTQTYKTRHLRVFMVLWAKSKTTDPHRVSRRKVAQSSPRYPPLQQMALVRCLTTTVVLVSSSRFSPLLTKAVQQIYVSSRI
jgi:hypothetical protein